MSIKLVEYGNAEEYSPISSLEIERSSKEWKNRLGLEYLPFSLSISDNKEKIRAIGIAGFININGTDIEIRPKFLQTAKDEEWRKLLWNILALTENYSNNIFGKSGVEQAYENTNFLDIMGWAFLNSTKESIAEGMPRGYVEKEGFYREIKGSINYTKIKYILEKPFLFPCKYDEYNEDIPVNRLLKWAGLFLSERVKSFHLSYMIRESTSLMSVNSIPPGPIEAENITLPVQFNYMQPALSIAKLLLKQENLYHRSNTLTSFGFLWKSYQVYEDFLHKVLSISIRHLGSNTNLEAQYQITVAHNHKDGIRDLTEKPDFKIKDGNDIIYILDAKYKIGNTPKPEDLNQIIVACKIEKCMHGILLFPSNNEKGTYHRTWKISSKGFPKYISSIHLNLEKMSEARGEYKLAKEIANELNNIKLYT